MPSESLHDTPAEPDLVDSTEKAEPPEDCNSESSAKLPVDLSQFSQRLASFGLGETPDPLLTESRHPNKRRPRR
jgi:hypothetical protein